MASSIEIETADAQQIAELTLGLRNLSYLLSAIASNESALQPDQIAASLFKLHRQVDQVSHRLELLTDRCRSCIVGACSGSCTGNALQALDPGQATHSKSRTCSG